MIAHVMGKVAQKHNGSVVIDVLGIGYEVQVSLSDFERATLGAEQKFHTYHHVREQSQELFGFSQLGAKKLFEQLLSVKNVGPKVALSVLDIGPVEAIKAAIAGGDVKSLQQAKGVGKRAAEQMVVELRDKLGTPVGDAAEGILSRSGVNPDDEALQALMALGYSDVDAARTLNGIDEKLPVEERIKQALREAG